MIRLSPDLANQYPHLGFVDEKSTARDVPTYTKPDLSSFHPTCGLQSKGCTSLDGALLVHEKGMDTPIVELKGAKHPACFECTVYLNSPLNTA